MAMAVLLIIGAIVSLAVARALTAQGEVKNVRALSSQMASLLNQAATSPYDKILDGSFERPAVCASDEMSSCITLGTTEIEVGWNVALGPDMAGNSLTAASSVTLTNTATLPNGRELKASKVVKAPSAGWKTGYSVLRVVNTGDSYDGSIFLMSGSSVVDSRSISDGAVLLRAPKGVCEAAVPCYLALDDKGNLMNQAVTFDAADGAGAASVIKMTTGALSSASVNIHNRAVVNIALQAQKQGAGFDGVPEKGSICLWAHFLSGPQTQDIPLCNFSDPLAIGLDQFTYAGKTFGMPVGTQVTWTTDGYDGKCHRVSGKKGYGGQSQGWVEGVDVCTSWTWGQPTSLQTGSGITTFERAVTTLDKSNSFKASWGSYDTITADISRPAVAYGNQKTWSRPRDFSYNHNAASGSTTWSMPSSLTPETTTCPGQNCFSSTNLSPYLTGPRSGELGYSYVKLTGASTPLSLNFTDEENDAPYIIVSQVPSQGTLYYDGNPISSNMGISLPSGQNALALTYTTTQNVSSIDDNFSFTFYGSDVQNVVYLSAAPKEAALYPEPVTSGQEKSVTIRARLYSNDGNPVNGSVITLSGVPGVKPEATTAVTDSGWATFKLDLSSAAEGDYSIPLSSSSGKTGELKFTVTQTLSSIKITSSTERVSINASDGAGVAYKNQFVNLSLESDSLIPRGVYLQQSGCTTDANGTCSVALVKENPDTDLSAVKVVATVGALRFVSDLGVF